jgi:hypothetical protein
VDVYRLGHTVATLGSAIRICNGSVSLDGLKRLCCWAYLKNLHHKFYAPLKLTALSDRTARLVQKRALHVHVYVDDAPNSLAPRYQFD